MTSHLSVFSDVALSDELTSRGWRVSKDDGAGWETPKAFSKRHGLHHNYLCKLISRGTVPPGLELHRARGGKGRLVMVRSSQTTENWMECRKKVCV